MHCCTRAIRFSASIAILLCLAPLSANAGTIEIHSFFKGVGVGLSFNGTDDAFIADGFGSVVMSNAQGLGSLDAAGAFEAYCVEMLGDIFNPGSSTDPGPGVIGPDFPPGVFVTIPAEGHEMAAWSDPADGIAGAGPKAAWLYTAFNPFIQFQTNAVIPLLGTFAADIARTALAVSIWEVLYEDAATYGVDDGNGRFSVYCDKTLAPAADCTSRPQGTVVSLANAMLASLGASTAPATWLKLGVEGDPVNDVQNFVAPASRSTVPEPASSALVVAGLAALAMRRRARR